MAPGTDNRTIPNCRVSVAGAKLEADRRARLTSVVVDLDADLFARCELSFNDPELKLINGKDFDSGAKVAVELGFSSTLAQVFQGEVVALAPQFRRDQPPALNVICFDSLHRLALSSMTRSFLEVDDQEIISTIAREHGLSGEGPRGTKAHVLQANVSDAAFLRRLAQKQGNHVRIEGKKIIVGPPPKGSDVTLGPDAGIARMKVRLNAGVQVSEVTVHGWDAKSKREVSGSARPQGETGAGAKSHGKGVVSFAGHEHAPVDPATAEKMAQGRLRRLAERYASAEVVVQGNPALVPGAQVKVEKLGAQIDGTWRIERAAHTFNKHGYSVRFRAVRIAKASPPKAAKVPSQAPAREEPPPDVHLVHVEVKSVGGTLLPNHPVRLLDAATGEPVGEIMMTDDAGLLRGEAPKGGKYRLEILDRTLDAGAGPALGGSAPAASLVVRFLGTGGGPIAGEEVLVTISGDSFKLTTGPDGGLDAPATLGPYQLKLRGETFVAHAVAAKEKEHGLHQFVVGEEKHDQHLLTVLVKGLGDTPLAHHPVRVLDPDNAEPVTGWLETDGEGLLHAPVPDERTYRVEIGDRAAPGQGAGLGGSDPGVTLACEFVTPGGGALANEDVEVKSGEESFKLKTDARGRLEAPAHLGAFELRLRGETFVAHAVPAADAGKGLYRFVIGEERHDQHLLAVLVKSLGGTPLPHHPVRVLDPDNGTPITGWLETDGDGLLRAAVPDDRTWRLELGDRDAFTHEPPPPGGSDPGVRLCCQFVSPGGGVFANEAVEATSGGETFALRTDEQGRLDAPAHLGAYELTLRGQSFQAHAVLAADADKATSRFVVTEPEHDQHALAVQVHALGGTRHAGERVRVLDPDNGEPIGDWRLTDPDGVLRAAVPDGRTYRLQLEDRPPLAAPGPSLDAARSGGMLVCWLTDAAGAPLSHEAVLAGDARLETDARGYLEAAADLRPYSLNVRGQTFLAHGLPADDAEREENHYRFQLED